MENKKRGRPAVPLRDRFWKHVDTSGGPDSCWTWVGTRARMGYGIVHYGGGKGMGYAHRAVFEMEHGPLPKGVFVCHRCDNPPCVNPAHLFFGTALENARDRAEKGRSASPSAVLTADQVMDLRRRHANGEKSWQLEERFGVGRTAVAAIVSGKVWRSVPMT